MAAVALLPLALGIGANTARFSPIDAVLPKDAAGEGPRQLVALTDPNNSGVSIGLSTGEHPMHLVHFDLLFAVGQPRI